LTQSYEKWFDAGGKTFPEDQGLEFSWISSRLSQVAGEMDRALSTYRFDEAASIIYQFFWGEFCDWYLELVKLRLDFDAKTNIKTRDAVYNFVLVFDAALRLLSPFMPFLTEELWHALHEQVSAERPLPFKSIALVRYPKASDFFYDPISIASMTALQELIVTIRALRKELGVPEKEAVPIELFAASINKNLVKENTDMLSRLARVSEVKLVDKSPTGNNSRSTSSFDVAVVYERQIDIPAERERLTKDLIKFNKGIEAANKQLTNEGFTSRAPAHIIEGLKKQYAETTALKEKAEAALAALPNP
jgi:valyl-tRNA synthetase